MLLSFFCAILIILIGKLFISYLQIGPFYLLISGTHLNQYKKIFSEFQTKKIISQKFDRILFIFRWKTVALFGVLVFIIIRVKADF